MGRQLAHRGPDDQQFYLDDFLALLHRRLSIIDVPGGQQPIWNEDRSLFVCVNGEIYNHTELRSTLRDKHVFRTLSDSEIVLHLYEERGSRCLELLNGMFAIVIWDAQRRQLLLARDRLGIKPLYYSELDELLLFGSELKALLAHPECPRELNWRHLHPTRSQNVDEVPSYLCGVKHLRGGYYLIARTKQRPHTKAYWSIDEYMWSGGDAYTFDQYTHTYGDLLHDSIRKRLMSDVPLGIFLSGGIDSSLIAAIASEDANRFHCFTVAEDSTMQSGDVSDATKLAKQLRLPLHKVRFDHRTLLDQLQFDLNTFEYFIWMMDSPRFNLEWVFKHELHRYVKTVLPELKVILLGQGADEFAGGYSNQLHRPQSNWNDYMRFFSHVYQDMNVTEAGIPSEFLPLLNTNNHDQWNSLGERGRYRHIIKCESRTLQARNLWHEDRSSSAQGVEARVPFLDHRLVELMASVPPQLQPILLFNKRIVREQLRRFIPDYPQNKPKIGFFLTGRYNSVNHLYSLLVDRIFPEFTEKYLCGADTLFSQRALQRLHLAAMNESKKLIFRRMPLLIETMALVVFLHQVENLPAVTPAPLEPPSPLRAMS